MIKCILVGGYVHKAPDEGRAFCEELIKGIDKKPVKILDCMFARKKEDWQESMDKDNLFFSKFIKDFELELADSDRFTEQVKNSDIIYLRGGYASSLMELLSKSKNWTKELEGKVLAGISAWADAVCKYYGVGKTGNIGEGLGLLPIKLIPHWLSDYDCGLDIGWMELKEKLEKHKEELPVYTLSEGEFVVINSTEI